MTEVKAAPLCPACEMAVHRVRDQILPRVLASRFETGPVDCDLDLERFSATGRRWYLAGLAAGSRSPAARMADAIEISAGDGKLKLAAARCTALAKDLAGGGGVMRLRAVGSDTDCCLIEIDARAAEWWRDVGSSLVVRETQRGLVRSRKPGLRL